MVMILRQQKSRMQPRVFTTQKQVVTISVTMCPIRVDHRDEECGTVVLVCKQYVIHGYTPYLW